MGIVTRRLSSCPSAIRDRGSHLRCVATGRGRDERVLLSEKLLALEPGNAKVIRVRNRPGRRYHLAAVVGELPRPDLVLVPPPEDAVRPLGPGVSQDLPESLMLDRESVDSLGQRALVGHALGATRLLASLPQRRYQDRDQDGKDRNDDEQLGDREGGFSDWP